MSVKVLTRVWKHSKHKRSDKLVLLAIADHCAFDDGTGAWPAQSTIATKTGLSDRRVRTILDKLVASGELVIEDRKGKSARYTIATPEETSDPCRCFGCTDWKKLPTTPEVIAGQGGRNFRSPRKSTSYEPNVTVPRNHQEPSSLEATASQPPRKTTEEDAGTGRAFLDERVYRDRFASVTGRWPTPEELRDRAQI